jgi:hypothetical protein
MFGIFKENEPPQEPPKKMPPVAKHGEWLALRTREWRLAVGSEHHEQV